jgi:peroxiredoxin Q/BCP
VGISTDPIDEQKKFTEKENLNFPLFADADKAAARAYGVLSSKGYAKRVTFVIDKDGVIRKVYEVKNIPTHPQEVLAYIESMK